jgi:hypothetical protein
LAKNRYHLPEMIPFNWSSFTGAIATGLSQTFNSNPNNKEQ